MFHYKKLMMNLLIKNFNECMKKLLKNINTLIKKIKYYWIKALAIIWKTAILQKINCLTQIKIILQLDYTI